MFKCLVDLCLVGRHGHDTVLESQQVVFSVVRSGLLPIYHAFDALPAISAEGASAAHAGARQASTGSTQGQLLLPS